MYAVEVYGSLTSYRSVLVLPGGLLAFLDLLDLPALWYVLGRLFYGTDFGRKCKTLGGREGQS